MWVKDAGAPTVWSAEAAAFTIAVRATGESAGAGLPLGQFRCGIIRKSGSSTAALQGTLALDGMRQHGLELVLVALRIR